MKKYKYAKAITELLDCTTLTDNELSVLNCYIEHQNYENPSCCQGESGDCCGYNVLDIVKNKLLNKRLETTNEEPKCEKCNSTNLEFELSGYICLDCLHCYHR